ncbi:hypothetical protein Acr_00g0093120 [Actinidia rufa]|uniref:TFIIS central domain-containing protein n=1 Tax=Actinidia rufa TaxID=165716 RepID=A0A7J0E043_9ERIC|nr:hypothetical protein Acr_00g0093120 [Actinidia rufa]
MSNNLVSQPLSVPNKQMNPISNELEASIPNIQMGMTGGMSNSPRLQHFEISKKHMGLMESAPNNLGLQNPLVLNKQMGSMEQQVSGPGLQEFLRPNQQVGDVEAMLSNMGSQKILLPSKRSAVGEPIVRNSVAQQLMPNKNVARMEAFTNTTGMQQLPSPNKKTIQVHSNFSTPASQNLPASTKKMVRNESISGRSGTKQSQTPKNRTTQMEPSAKVHTESFESVRSKMRESLASALALVTQQQDKTSNEESNSGNQQMQQGPQRIESTSMLADAADHESENPPDSLPLKESCSAGRANKGHSASQAIFVNESMVESAQTWKGDGHLIQCNTVLANEDVSFGDSFFVKDELLQGNGLAWALDVDVDVGELKEIQIAKKPKLENEKVGGVREEQAVQSPKSMALRIEVELFKLFGGVNKKYKERGRSLLFNLKDRNNPELRERVMSGELPPERLCSMTAEELASKELSQWRIAKAEEFAQMVVLPDSDVDIRRLVRKTHKGEFQVEVEQDDGVSVEVSVGTSALTRLESKNRDMEDHHSANADEIKDRDNVEGEKSSSENQDLSCSLTIPNDGTDLLQGLMVDEFKDAEFLPPIVSLDEFMESLDSEPPFENLPMDGGKISPSDKESSDQGSKDPVGATTEKSDKVEVKFTDSDVKTKSKESSTEPKSSPPDAASKCEHVWEGELQLTISAAVTVVGFFKSGEKTSTKEWPSSLEIKGRVRLDAFEKFIQDLPMSRSRAVMVVHFVLKDGSSENDRVNLSEVVDSYVSDERLGFAEPAPGVELYLCPPHTKIVEMLSKHLSKGHTDTLNSIESGLIGIIVWRKPHLSSAISPNSSAHHKHSSKRQHFTPRRHHEKDPIMNANFASKQTLPPMGDDDDDIPPGFGPAAARDEDDLPEFNFSGPTNPSVPKHFNSTNMSPCRPVDQVRALIHKYGQPSSNVISRNVGIRTQPWNNDDDDIPEWQPQPLTQHHLPPQQPPVLNFQPPVLPQAVNQHPVNMVQGMFVAPPQGDGMWQQPPGYSGLQPSNIGTQPSGGQHYGVPVAGQLPGIGRRRDAAPRSRGF